MIEQVNEALIMLKGSFLHLLPYMLITIPIAVAVNMSGASRYIGKAMKAKPVTAIFLAMVIGAFSPLCSCGVIPVVWSLLVGGVPLAPVMVFWLASPSMDPELFFLSASMIGWNLAVWRLLTTMFLSLGAGFIIHLLVKKEWLGEDIVRNQPLHSDFSLSGVFKAPLNLTKNLFHRVFPIPEPLLSTSVNVAECGCGSSVDEPTSNIATVTAIEKPRSKVNDAEISSNNFYKRLVSESAKATWMISKFMLLAIFLETLIKLYVPSEWILGVLGVENDFAIINAALLGVPVYTNTLAALGMVGGLLTQGMSPAAALAFLIAGPTTTIPAMAAVWSLVKNRIFALYVGFTLLGAILFAWIFNIAN
ncbi:hypothetical protein E3V33_02925 [Candidatus Marinimicrobia bacterium MT.SAG.4]|nr:hypothetical protein E3V33_02925 [Candidatus Marinimicrobia bacterium MT.SAG.4]